VPSPLAEALEVGAQQRRQRGVDHGRRAALVLPEHAGGLVRGRDVHTRQLLGRQLGGEALVPGMEEAPQEADRDRLDVQLREGRSEGFLVEVAQHALGAGALAHGNPQLGRHERRRVAGAEAVQLRPGLAAELLEVGETLGGQQRRARHPPLEQRVRADGHPVYQPPHVRGGGARAIERLGHGVHHALGLVPRRRGRLARDEPVARQQRRVSEGAPDVNAQNHRRDATRSARRPGRIRYAATSNSSSRCLCDGQ
jgi:hypothetical protein